MERIVQLVRDNTIDYDWYFSSDGSEIYEDVFYKDTNEDGVVDRQLGGIYTDGRKSGGVFEADPDTEAFDNTIDEDSDGTWDGLSRLALINADRTLRNIVVAMGGEEGDGSGRLHSEVQAGVDSNGDKKADKWVSDVDWDGADSICRPAASAAGATLLYKDAATAESCAALKQLLHTMTPISPANIYIKSLRFFPSPNRDPFLAFAVEEAQIHPHVFVTIETTFAKPEDFGFDEETNPEIAFQTSASSRVFGNTR